MAGTAITDRLRRAGLLVSLVCLVSCERRETDRPPSLTRAWNSETFAGCVLASLQSAVVGGKRVAVAATGDGRVVALDPETGATIWSLALPHPDGVIAHVVATPALLPGSRLVVAWQDLAAPDASLARRNAHHVAVIDIAQAKIDAAFPLLTLAAEKPSGDGTGTVRFSPANALSRSRLVHVDVPGQELGLVYVSFGNASDVQPWHGWVFELDLDGWRRGAAIRSTLLTTPTNDCETSGIIAGIGGTSLTRCGGGVWAPGGPLLVENDQGFELIVPTGNGRLDLQTRAYGQALMRIRGPGLGFDPRCDAGACASFDVAKPSLACLESCQDLFLPRLMPGEPPLDPQRCKGLSFLECFGQLDWGGSSPARVDLDGARVYVLPSKDGGVYLLDADHLGKLYDREQIVTACGDGEATCFASWAGMMVTQPAITELDGAPVALFATFMPDAVHPAGVVALRITEPGGVPALERLWEAPSFASEDAGTGFRRHPSAIQWITVGEERYAAVVDQGIPRGALPGRLHLIRVRDGAIRATADLAGPGQRFAEPLRIGHRLLMASCEHGNNGPGHVEAWDVAGR